MKSPRTATALLAAAAASAVAGCNTLETTTQAKLAPEPRVAERYAGTTQPVRAFPPIVANYQNGDTTSDSTGVRYISDVGQLFGRGGRTTRSDVVASSGGGSGYTTAVAGSEGTGGTTASAGVGVTSGGTSGGVAAGGNASTGGDETVVSNIQSSGSSTNAQTPAIAGGSTVNGNVVRSDGSIAAVGSPGAAGTTASIAAAPGGVSQSVGAEDIGALDGNAGDTAVATGTGSAGTPGAPLSTGQTIAAGAALPFVETGTFLANIVTSPVTFYQQRHGIVSGGYEFRPTSTAMPAMSPEPGRVPPRRSTAPLGIVAPPQPLSPLPGVLPATRPAAERAATNLKSVLPPIVPVSPSTTMPAPPSTMPSTPMPKPLGDRANVIQSGEDGHVMFTPDPFGAAVKPGTLRRAPDVSTNAFVVAGSAPYAGRFEVQPNLTLDGALRGAGVLPADASSVMIRLQRRGSSVSTPVTLASLRARTGTDALVQPGDILTVTTSR